MTQAIRFNPVGGPDVLHLQNIKLPAPQRGEVRLRQAAVGLNYADTYFRNGTYTISLPSGIGVEGAGVVTELGDDVDNVKVGDRVTYTGFINTLGAYASDHIVPTSVLIPLPDIIDFETAAAATMRGLTAAYLLRRLYPFKAGDTLLLHAAAGGLGLIVSQWAKLLGVEVIGAVSSDAKAELALKHGCAHVINYSHENVAQRVREITNGVGVDVVFDSVGKSTFLNSLDTLKKRGWMVCVGAASGPIPAFDPHIFAVKGSLHLTRPALADYISDPAEKKDLVSQLFALIASGRINVDIQHRYELAQAPQAHHALESRELTGSSIFVI